MNFGQIFNYCKESLSSQSSFLESLTNLSINGNTTKLIVSYAQLRVFSLDFKDRERALKELCMQLHVICKSLEKEQKIHILTSNDIELIEMGYVN